MYLETVRRALPSSSIMEVDYLEKGSMEKSLVITSYYYNGK